MKLPSTYKAKEFEKSIYKMWEESGYFQPKGSGEPFSIVLPPPNATGKLHVGHSAMLAIEDTVVRYERMKGKDVLWVPGTDHAAIATNAILERQLAEEGKSKHDIGREEFLKRLHEYVENSKDEIRQQLRAMGSSLDWSRERYTMEPAMNNIVAKVFIQMYEDGLIYRGSRIINWDSKLQTTVSDDEVDHEEEITKFYTFKYGPFEIGTARPETKFGDKYVVVHPDDQRYKDYKHGDTFEAEWINGKITGTVIKDEAIDPEFGTGAMTITPWHDPVDFEIAERHNLDKEQVIGFNGKLLSIAKEFEGMTIEEARPKIVEKLQAKGLVVKVEDNYKHTVGISDRGKVPIEPQIMAQWFIDVNKPVVEWKGKKKSLKEIMRQVVEDGEIQILPKRFEKIYYHWIDNLHDWNISRQIWWGHQVPAWFRVNDNNEKEYQASIDAPGDDWVQDSDTLDTWFSSALWTFSTLIDPELGANKELDLSKMLAKSPDFKKYHPTTLMETGYDIIFFWVTRMILMTTYITGEIPFKTVYLHGLVRTKDGAKMSKSHPETTIDPIEMIKEYGTDALRLSMIVGQTPGIDMRIYKEKIAAYRNFANKLWNVSRFIEGKIGDNYQPSRPNPKSHADHWILHQLEQTSKYVDERMDKYRLGQAYERLYHFIWNDFADWYIEVAKVDSKFNPSVLTYVLEETLKLTHPFAPFVTEAIWNTLEWHKEPLMIQEWPKIISSSKKEAEIFEEIQAIIKEIRYLRTQLQMSENKLYYIDADFIADNCEVISKLTGLKGCQQVTSGKGVNLTSTKHTCWIDIEEQRANEHLMKLIEKKEKAEQSVKNLTARLENKNYLKSAPKDIVNQSKEQLEEETAHLERILKEVDSFEHFLKKT